MKHLFLTAFLITSSLLSFSQVFLGNCSNRAIEFYKDGSLVSYKYEGSEYISQGKLVSDLYFIPWVLQARAEASAYPSGGFTCKRGTLVYFQYCGSIYSDQGQINRFTTAYDITTRNFSGNEKTNFSSSITIPSGSEIGFIKAGNSYSPVGSDMYVISWIILSKDAIISGKKYFKGDSVSF